MNVRKRGLALLMCICMIFTLLPFSAFADATEKASSITIEYWCTNTRVTGSDGNTSKEVTPSSTAPQYLTNIAPGSGSSSNRNYVYWKTVVLPEGHHQDIKDGNNGSTDPKGVEILAIKQIDGKNYYFSVSKPDTAVLIKNDDQIVSYYKQVLVNSAEYGTITGSDWGNNKWSENAPLKVEYFIDADNMNVAEKSFFYNKSTKPEDTIKSIGIIPADGYKVVKLMVSDEDSSKSITYTEGDKLTSDTLVLDRASGKTVIYYLEKIVDLKVEYEWIGAPSSATLPTDSNTYTNGDTVAVDTNYDDTTTVTEGGYTYTFSGWFFDTTYENSAGESFEIQQPTKLYGYWTPTANEYNVTYTVIGAPNGYTAPTASTAAFGSTVTVADTPDLTKYTDYTFSGWECNDEDVIVGADNTFTMPARDVVFTGTWEKIPTYNVTYDWGTLATDMGDISAPVDNVNYKANDTVTVQSPSAEAMEKAEELDYTFSGWECSDVTVTDGKFTMPERNVTLVAQWTREVHYANGYVVKHYWIGDKVAVENGEDIKPLFKMNYPDKVEVGETVTYIGNTRRDGYTMLPDNQQKRSVVISEDESKNVIYIYHSKNITVTAGSDEVTYDGTKHVVDTFKATVNDGGKDVTTDLKEGIFAYVGGTDAGEYTVKLYNKYRGVPLSLEEDANKYCELEGGDYLNGDQYYVTKVVSGTLTINRRSVTITGDNKEVYYNGTEQTFTTGYTVEGLVDGHEIDKEGLTHTLKGKDIDVHQGEFSLDAIDIVIYYFDESIKENVIVSDNYTVTLTPGTLTIKSRPVTPPVIKHDLIITAGSKTGIAPVTCDEYTVEGLVNGDVVASVKITGSQNEPGESANVASDAVIKNSAGVDVTKNYNIKYVDGVLKAIEPLNKEDHFNYIIGIPDGTVKPLANITRAEVATIFFRLLTDEARDMYSVTTSSFSDVADGVWYTRAIATLANAGILKGDPAGTFRPADPITRAEMAAVIARFAKLDVNTKTFSDIEGHWAKNYIELAAGNGWINGTPEGEFQPDRNITRAETVAMINRVLDRQTENVSDLLPADQMTTWSDNMDTTQWYYKDMQEATNYHKCERVGDSIYEKWTEKLPEIDWASYQI